MVASQVVLSLLRAAGWPLMNTEEEPCATCCTLSLSQATVLRVATAATLPLIKTLPEPVIIVPLGLIELAPASTHASRAFSPRALAAMPTAIPAPISKKPTPRQADAHPAPINMPPRIPPATLIRPPRIVPPINPARAP
ncbi:hypothetical protein D3C72_2024160 [compost metagenome]